MPFHQLIGKCFTVPQAKILRLSHQTMGLLSMLPKMSAPFHHGQFDIPRACVVRSKSDFLGGSHQKLPVLPSTCSQMNMKFSSSSLCNNNRKVNDNKGGKDGRTKRKIPQSAMMLIFGGTGLYLLSYMFYHRQQARKKLVSSRGPIDYVPASTLTPLAGVSWKGDNAHGNAMVSPGDIEVEDVANQYELRISVSNEDDPDPENEKILVVDLPKDEQDTANLFELAIQVSPDNDDEEDGDDEEEGDDEE